MNLKRNWKGTDEEVCWDRALVLWKKNLLDRGLTKFEKHCLIVYVPQNTAENHKKPLATAFPQSRFQTRIPCIARKHETLSRIPQILNTKGYKQQEYKEWREFQEVSPSCSGS
jgi:predicted phosphoadenosine phosphosulfate sulfurtransferase